MRYLTDTINIQLNNRHKESLFLDIETTGLSSTCQIYLIGAGVFKDNMYHIHQWFAESPDDEKNILEALSDFLKSFTSILTFNGQIFDIPFIKARCQLYDIDIPWDSFTYIDLYKLIRPYRNILGLPNVKQKTIEEFLNIHRHDMYNGGQLIKVYRDYLENGSDDLLSLLLLHNHDDMAGLALISPVEEYISLFNGDMDVTPVLCKIHEYKDFDHNNMYELLITARLPISFSGSFSNLAGPYFILVHGDTLKVSIKIFKKELKYFFENYKDYYYLPDEDAALHKSVAEYVDKDHRVRAKADTCYIRKEAMFLPQESDVFSPYFRENRKDKTSYFEYCDSILHDDQKQAEYIKNILKWQKGLSG